MSRSVAISALPSSLRHGLTRLGEDIRRARVRREMTLAEVAQRCLMTVPTLRKIEKGDPTVSLGAVAAALWCLGLSERLSDLLDRDPIGEALEDRRRPKSVRHRKEDDF